DVGKLAGAAVVAGLGAAAARGLVGGAGPLVVLATSAAVFAAVYLLSLLALGVPTPTERAAARGQVDRVLQRCGLRRRPPGRRGGRLIAIAPLAVRPRSLSRLLPWPSLEFLGTGLAGSDYLDVIVRRGHEREGLAAVADALAAAGAVLELSHVPANVSAAAQLAGDLARRLGWTASASRINVCPFIKLSGHSWPSYLASLGSAHRYNVQRRLKNLTKQFDVRFEQATSEEQRREALELLIDLHNRRWSERGGSQSFATAALRAFYDDVSR